MRLLVCCGYFEKKKKKWRNTSHATNSTNSFIIQVHSKGMSWQCYPTQHVTNTVTFSISLRRQGRCARDALSHTFNSDVFKTINRNSTTIKHIHNESANFIDNCDVAFNTNNWWNQPKTVQMIGMESMVTRPPLRYTRDYLPPGICSLIKSIAVML